MSIFSPLYRIPGKITTGKVLIFCVLLSISEKVVYNRDKFSRVRRISVYRFIGAMASYGCQGMRIATPACGLVRNDICFRCPKRRFRCSQLTDLRVIASQCSHWRGNPFSCNAQHCVGQGRHKLPHKLQFPFYFSSCFSGGLSGIFFVLRFFAFRRTRVTAPAITTAQKIS